MLKELTIWCLLIFLMGCNPVPEICSGTASALKNGEKWEAVVVFFEKSLPFGTGFDLGFRVFNNEGFRRESMTIFRVKNSFEPLEIFLTNSQLNNDSTGLFYASLIDDGDVVGDIYDLDTTAINNFIQITNYNSSKAEIEGIFNVTLILNRDDGDGETPPEKLEFSNGKFTTKVEREWFE